MITSTSVDYANALLRDWGWNWQYGGQDPHSCDAPRDIHEIATWLKVVNSVAEREERLRKTLADLTSQIDDLGELRLKMVGELDKAIDAAKAMRAPKAA